jgi:hypothetical protein
MQKPKQERPILANEKKNQERADTQVMRNSRSKNYGMGKVRKLGWSTRRIKLDKEYRKTRCIV